MRLFTAIPTRAAARGLLVTLSLTWSGLPVAAQTDTARTETVQAVPLQTEPLQTAPLQAEPIETGPVLAADFRREPLRLDQPLAPSPAQAAPTTQTARAADPRLLHDYVARLPIGSHVKIRLLSGDTFKGTLMRVDPDTIIVKPRTRTPQPERHIPLTELDFVDPDPQNGSKMGKVAGIAILAAAATFVGIVLLMHAIYND